MSEKEQTGEGGPSRRSFLRAGAATIGAASLPASTGAGAAPVERTALLSESFESYDTGTYPSSWRKNGNEDQYVTDETASDGSQSLRIKGSSGGCWEALANGPLSVPTDGRMTISGAVKPTSNGEVGCHDTKRAGIKLQTSDDGWDAGDGTLLLKFRMDGTLNGPGGVDLGSYEVDAWNEFEVTYERSDTSVELSYTINGEPRGSTTRAVASFEDDLEYVRLASGEFTVFYDDLEAVAETGTSGLRVETRDFTGDGRTDVRLSNEETWVLFEGQHRDSRVFASRVGQSGQASAGGPWQFKPTDRDANQFVHQETTAVDAFERSDGVGYHVHRTFEVGGVPVTSRTTVYLPAGSPSPLVRMRWTNESASDLRLDQEFGHIHDGIMIVKGVPVSEYGSDYRFHTTGSGTHEYGSTGKWSTFELSGTYPTVTSFDGSDALSYGIVDGRTGARHAVTNNGDPPEVVDMMVRETTLSSGETGTYTVAVGAHEGGSGAPSRASDAVSTAASYASDIPTPDGGGGGGNDPPTADLDYAPSNPETGETVTFDASLSTDGDGSVASYEWDLDGDGTVDATDATTTRAYDSAGSYEVSLTVTDDDGASDTASTTVDVEGSNEPPEAAFDVDPSDPTAGETVRFDASASSDPDGSIARYEWDLNDDGSVEATDVTTTRTWSESGEYDVSLTVVDDADATDTATRTVSVGSDSEPSPSFEFTPSSPAPGDEVSFDATGSTDDGTIEAFDWDFDDDGRYEESGDTATYAFSDVGEQPVTLRVVDDAGQSAQATRTVSVGGGLTAKREQKLDLAGSIDEASVVSSFGWATDGNLGDQPLAKTTFDALEAGVADGTVTADEATAAADRLILAEGTTKSVLELTGPEGGDVNFVRTLAKNFANTALNLLLIKYSLGKQILSFAPAWVTSTWGLQSVVSTVLDDAWTTLVSKFLSGDGAKASGERELRRAGDDLWAQLTADAVAGADAIREYVNAAIDGVIDVLSGIFRAALEFFTMSGLEYVSNPPEDLADVVMGDGIWNGMFELHESMRPDAIADAGGLPGSGDVAAEAASTGRTTIESRLPAVRRNIVQLNEDVGDLGTFASLEGVLAADGWADIGVELLQTVLNIVSDFAGIVTNASGALSASMSLVLTRRIHMEVVESAIHGENRVDGWISLNVQGGGVGE